MNRLADHIQVTAGHFAGQVYSWDVVNEAIGDSPSFLNWRNSIRQSDLWKSFKQGAAEGESGADYIDFAFRQAREADPGAVLYYNDYGLDNSVKARTVAAMVKELNEAWLAEGNDRLLIEGIGMQGHYNLTTSPEAVDKSIKLFADLGVMISITELDITTGGGDELSEADELKQAAQYAELFKVFKANADAIERVTFWGLDDGSSWRASNYPLLFHSDLSPKQAWFAVADPEGWLAGYTPPPPPMASSGYAAYGTPVIDGKMDDIWSTAEELPITKMLQAWDTASGTARVLWDKEYLYVYFSVTDPLLDSTSYTVHERDSVEAFVDEDNCKAGTYRQGDGQYRVDIDNFTSTNDSTDMIGFVSAVTIVDGGYDIEMAIPWKVIVPEAGLVIGFDAQINDGEEGARVGIAKWNDPTDNSWVNTTGWGTLTLK